MNSTSVPATRFPVDARKPPDRPMRPGLDALFVPRSVAVIGATDRPGTVGRSLVANLLGSRSPLKIHAVNPGHAEVLGLKTYAHVRDIPGTLDLALVVTPSQTVPQVISDCVDAGVKNAVVISAGFRERGAEGAALEDEIQKHLRRGSMRLIGPNCMGFMNPSIGLNATFAKSTSAGGQRRISRPERRAANRHPGLERARACGIQRDCFDGLDAGCGLGRPDLSLRRRSPHEEHLLYMESVGDARSFLSAAREIALSKPIIVIKAGRSEAASRAAASHTGALTGSDEVLDAALRRCGILRVQNIADLFYMAEVLSKQPRPRGPHLTIVTNAGGPGVLATDALIATGAELTTLSEKTLRELDSFLSPYWSHANPVDVLADADAERFARAVDVASKDPASDGLLAIIAPQGLADPKEAAERLKAYAHGSGKPVLASWMGGPSVEQGTAILNSAGIPTFTYPDTAARAFTYMWRYTYNLRGLYETPALAGGPALAADARSSVMEIVSSVRESGRTLLNEYESKQLLSRYGIPTVETRVASSEEEAVACAAEIGYPAVLKILSGTVAHKTDVGGVRLNLRNAEQVQAAYRGIELAVKQKAPGEKFAGVTVQPMIHLEGYELILGSSVDPQFGPVILFGSGGLMVEVYRDRALALPPLNTTLAQRLMEQTRIYRALQGVRGRQPVDLEALESLLVRFSQLVVEQPWIKEIDINPLLATPARLLALDARVLLQDRSIPASQLPRPAIRPYPSQYTFESRMKDGTAVTIRPIRPEDEPLMVKFHETLSERSVYLRYFCSLSLSTRVEHERLVRICFGAYDRGMALVADYKDPRTGEHQVLGVGRLQRHAQPQRGGGGSAGFRPVAGARAGYGVTLQGGAGRTAGKISPAHGRDSAG